MSVEQFDVLVVGGGPGGYVAAIRASQLRLRTALVERERLGGICLNWGCIPTKALLHSAELFEYFQHAHDYGLSVVGAAFDLSRIVQRSRGVAEQLGRGVTQLLRKNEVTIFKGHARLAGPRTVAVDDASGGHKEIRAEHIILATGARPRVVAPIEPDGRLIWSSREAMTPDRMPASLLVVGSGAIGIEFASFYRSLGAKVTLVEVAERVMPLEDAEVSSFVRLALERRGIKIMTGTIVDAVKKRADDVLVTVKSATQSEEIVFDRIIAAIGIVGNVENLGIENTGVAVEKSHVITDEWCRTGEQGVYAIGDVAGPPWLAHKASHEGLLCVERIAGIEGVHPVDTTRIPACVYGRPQVASIGYTEAKARDLGYEVKTGVFPFLANGKAVAQGEPEGFVKTVFDSKTGELLGAHLVGYGVTELIQGFSIGKTLETTEAQLIEAVFPHPTLSESLHEATLAAFQRAIHY